jgi:hypothetical protein
LSGTSHYAQRSPNASAEREFPMETHQVSAGRLGAHEVVGLIGSDKVEGTAVYRPNGDRIGAINRVMLDKFTGNVAYAVMSFGGFPGIGTDRYPIPWSLLTYNERFGGYEVNVTEHQLEKAPKFRENEFSEYEDRTGEGGLYAYYGVTPY